MLSIVSKKRTAFRYLQAVCFGSIIVVFGGNATAEDGNAKTIAVEQPSTNEPQPGYFSLEELRVYRRGGIIAAIVLDAAAVVSIVVLSAINPTLAFIGLPISAGLIGVSSFIGTASASARYKEYKRSGYKTTKGFPVVSGLLAGVSILSWMSSWILILTGAPLGRAVVPTAGLVAELINVSIIRPLWLVNLDSKANQRLRFVGIFPYVAWNSQDQITTLGISARF
jgi:hypothetical protein